MQLRADYSRRFISAKASTFAAASIAALAWTSPALAEDESEIPISAEAQDAPPVTDTLLPQDMAR